MATEIYAHMYVCNAIQCNTMQYHATPCNTMQYNAIPCNTVQYHAILCNTMQNHACLLTADGAYHCPVGSIWLFLFYYHKSSWNSTRPGGALDKAYDRKMRNIPRISLRSVWTDQKGILSFRPLKSLRFCQFLLSTITFTREYSCLAVKKYICCTYGKVVMTSISISVGKVRDLGSGQGWNIR